MVGIFFVDRHFSDELYVPNQSCSVDLFRASCASFAETPAFDGEQHIRSAETCGERRTTRRTNRDVQKGRATCSHET